MAGLPIHDTTGALARITGSAGEWSGISGVADLRTDAPVLVCSVNPTEKSRDGQPLIVQRIAAAAAS